MNAEKAGITVHFAEDAEQANAIIAKIAKDNSVKNIVKSKSMTAEETFLNDHLEKEGFKVTEPIWANGLFNCAMKVRHTWSCLRFIFK